MKVELVSIGTELLLGDIVNTNAHYLANELKAIGVNVHFQTVVGDNEERIIEAFDNGFKRADIIITTGGLGPTEDDISKEVAAKYLGLDSQLQLHEPSLNEVKRYFEKIGKPYLESNTKQAIFPKESIILLNPNGTAPGCIMKNNKGNIIIVLPGPPKEMQPMFNDFVVPYLKKDSEYIIESKVLRIIGVGESQVEELVREYIKNGKNPTVAPYAKQNDMILRLTAKGRTKEEVYKLIEPVEKDLKNILGDYIYGEGDTTIEEVVCNVLVNNNLTVSTAESCTGGLVGAKLINYPGISSVYLQGTITYSNEAKVKELNVKRETLDKFGAVSHEVAKEMSKGICEKSGSRIGISTTGIAGPGGGTKEKPIGLVYIGLCIDGEVFSFKNEFNGDRMKVRKELLTNP